MCACIGRHLKEKVLWGVTTWSEMKKINTSSKGIRNLESGKFLLVETGILGFGIWNTAQ